MSDRRCAQCNATLTGRQQLYCSQICSSRALNARRKADGRLAEQIRRRKVDPIKQRGYQAAHRARQKAAGNVERRRCRTCRELRPLGAICCGAKVSTHRPVPKRVQAARRALKKAERGTTGGRVRWASGRCRRCGDQFVARMCNADVPAYCSARCGSADRRDVRRARERGAKITPARRYRVFERDGWVCQICGDPVDRAAKVPDLAAPVIDHRIPLGAGGDHDEDNWQTAHFYCNSVKRDQLDFEFAA